MLCIVVRTDAQWLALRSEAAFIAQEHTVNVPTNLKLRGLLPAIRAWEAATGLCYFTYRETIRQACHSRLARIAPVTLAQLPANGNPNDVLAFIDDDDTFEESLVSILQAFTNPDVNVVTWTRRTWFDGSYRFETIRRYLDTNNWAIRRGFLETWHGVDRLRMMAKHQAANKSIAQRLGLFPKVVGRIGPDMFKGPPSSHVPLKHPQVVDINACHSTYYLHSASISYLTHKVGSANDISEEINKRPLHPLFNKSVYLQLLGDKNNGDTTERYQETHGNAHQDIPVSSVRSDMHG